MKEEIQKKVGITLLLLAIILATTFTLIILNSIQTTKVSEVVTKESSSGGEITLTVKEPPKIEDESTGSVSLKVLLPGGEE